MLKTTTIHHGGGRATLIEAETQQDLSRAEHRYNADPVIRLAAAALGDGFLTPSDREGWVHECPECGRTKAGSTGEHEPECGIGKAVAAIGAYIAAIEP